MNDSSFNKIRELICQQKYDQAWQVLNSLPDGQKISTDAIQLSARVQGQMGNLGQALSMFEDLEAAWPERPMIFRLHAIFLQETGLTEDALEKAREMISKFPTESAGYLIAIECLEILGEIAESMSAVQQALRKWPSNPELLEAKARLEPLADQRQQLDDQINIAREDLEINHCHIPTDNAFLTAFMSLFSGREGVHAQQRKLKGRNYGYNPVYEALDKKLLKSHLAGDKTLGLYFVKKDNTASMMAIDIDVSKPFLNDYINIFKERKRIQAILFETAVRLVQNAQSIGVEMLVELSGYKGVHLWAFSDFDLPARHWRLLGKWMNEQLYGVNAEVSIEIFPKQDMVPASGLGNLVKLPLGIHQKTGSRAVFVDSLNFRPFAQQREAIDGAIRITRSEFEEILGRITISQVSKSAKTVVRSDLSGEASVSPLKTDEGAKAESPDLSLQVKLKLPERFTIEIEKILSGCRPLYEILSSVIVEGRIEAGWRHVFIYIFSTVGEEGKVFVHQVLNQLDGYDPDKINGEIRAVPPNTMSCNKVRKNLGSLALKVGCCCQFRLPEGCYASPVVHAGIFPGSGKTVFHTVSEPAALSLSELFAGKSASIDKLMQEYQQVGEQLAKVQQRHIFLRNQINRLFDEAGTDEITTRLSTYTKLPEVEADEQSPA